MIRGNAATANYDFITTVCLIVIFIEAANSPQTNLDSELIIWPCYLFTIRIINAPVLLITIFAVIIFWKKATPKKIAAHICFSLLLIIPFVIRNVILSGYLFFPIYQIDLFNVDWKADKKLLIDIVEYIKYFNRVNNQHQPIAATVQLHFPAWINAWYKFLGNDDKILVSLSLPSFALLIIFWKKTKKRFNLVSRSLIIVFLLQIIFWFFTAPDPRFVYGELLCGSAYLFFLLPDFDQRVHAKIIKTATMVLAIAIGIYSANKIYVNKNYRNWILTQPLPVPEIKKINVGQITVNIPEKILNNWNPRCYGTDLPCLYYLDIRVKPRGKNIADGFMVDTANSSLQFDGEYKIKRN
jgi:hypothetical protein